MRPILVRAVRLLAADHSGTLFHSPAGQFRLSIELVQKIPEGFGVGQAVGHEHPLGQSYRGFVDLIPEELDRDQLERAMLEVPDEVLRQTFLWGTVDDVVDSIRRLGDAGLQHVSLMATSYSVSQKLAKYVWRAVPSIIRRLHAY